MGEEFELKRLYKDLESKYNTCRSDFCYSMINRLDIPNKQITIKADNYNIEIDYQMNLMPLLFE